MFSKLRPDKHETLTKIEMPKKIRHRPGKETAASLKPTPDLASDRSDAAFFFSITGKYS